MAWLVKLTLAKVPSHFDVQGYVNNHWYHRQTFMNYLRLPSLCMNSGTTNKAILYQMKGFKFWLQYN